MRPTFRLLVWACSLNDPVQVNVSVLPACETFSVGWETEALATDKTPLLNDQTNPAPGVAGEMANEPWCVVALNSG